MSASTNDLWNYWLQTQLPAGVVNQTAQPVPGSQAQNGYVGNSVTASGKVTAPGAGGLIATITNLTGLFEVQVTTAFGAGAPVAADFANMRSIAAAINQMTLFTPVTLGASNPPTKYVYRLNNQNLDVKAIAAATAGVDYWATITATQIGV